MAASFLKQADYSLFFESLATRDAAVGYLDDLHKSGSGIGFGAANLLQIQFGIDLTTARRWIFYWMETFVERYTEGRNEKEIQDRAG